MTVILLLLIVVSGDNKPVKGAWIDVEGMVRTEYYQEQVTDSHGVFIVEVEPGQHHVSVTASGYNNWQGNITIDDKNTDFTITLR